MDKTTKIREVPYKQPEPDEVDAVRISQLRKDAGDCPAITLRVLAVEHGIPLKRSGSIVYVPVQHIPRLIALGKAHMRKDAEMFGERVRREPLGTLNFVTGGEG